MTLLHQDDLITILISIYCFVEEFIKRIVENIQFSLTSPTKDNPPNKTHKLGIPKLVTLALFRFFTGHRNWKDFYRHIKSYHTQDFPELPHYSNFIDAVNKISFLGMMLLQGFMQFFKSITTQQDVKLADGAKLRVCEIKREFSHKVCARVASKSKTSMGWFYGFRLHIICNELMQILNFRITTGTTDERKTLEMMWSDILGMIIADAGYVGKNWQEKAKKKGIHLFTAVRANMKKLMTSFQHQLLKIRQNVETVFSVLKLRMGIENTLPRSELGHFAHYIWCLAAYQLKKFLEFFFSRPPSFSNKNPYSMPSLP